jgi:hypothetical protein
MDVERCDRCQLLRESCTCYCSKCQISFYDRRKPVIDKWKLYLMKTDQGFICSRCLTCSSCHDKIAFDNHLKWREISGTGQNLFKSRWYCPKELCRAAYKADPYRLDKAARRKEQQSFEGKGNATIAEAYPTAKAMLPLAVFDIDPREAFFFRNGLLSLFMLVFRKILCFRGEPQISETFCAKCNHIHRRKIIPREDVKKSNLRSEVQSRVTREFATEIAAKNQQKQESYERHLIMAKKRLAKYPDEKKKVRPPNPLELISNIRDLSVVIEHGQMEFRRSGLRGHMKRGAMRQTVENLSDKQLHANLSLWYLCRAVLDNSSLDGMQPILIEMLKQWWNLGYYPAICTDYTDVPNTRIREIVRGYLALVLEKEDTRIGSKSEEEAIGEEGYNQDVTECIVCFESPGSLVRFLPCGHKLVCTSCSPRFTKCVVCMYPISRRVTVESSAPKDPVGENSNLRESPDHDHADDQEESGEDSP